ncbi:hypothetical protein B566_EDAN005550 [Ephemera danica]|nr:hypothetical protein B566_EDAN005550 [Ephemera danica]
MRARNFVCKMTWKLFMLLMLMVLARSALQDTAEDNNNEVTRPGRPIDADNSKVQLIFPGTKWCGQGSIATGETDYGVFVETDKCCKAHDYCPDHISSGQTKHNLTNNGLFTKVHCDCEVQFRSCLKADNTVVSMKFRSCLKADNTVVSMKVGYTYFNVAGTECFKQDHPIVRCLKYSEVVKTRCEEYELDTRKPKEWQFFDNPLY